MTTSRYVIQLALAAILVLTGPAALAEEPSAPSDCAADQAQASIEGADPCPAVTPTDAPTATPSPEETPAPDATPTPGETPQPEESNDTPDPDATEEPSEESGGTAAGDGGKEGRSRSGAADRQPTSGDPSDLLVTVSVDRTIAQVGAPLNYEITVHNPGTEATTATIVDTMPDEVEFLSASGTLMPTVGARTLTWDILALQPGASLVLSWQGRVATAGDLDAMNVTAIADSTATPVESHTYLAAVKGVVLHRSPEEPDWGTHKERKVVFRTRTVYPNTVSSAPAVVSPGALPYTGVPVVPFIVTAALLLLGGWVLVTEKGRRVAAVSMLVVLVAAACTSGTPSQDRTDRADAQAEDEEGDQVLGTRVDRDGNGSDSNNGSSAGDDNADGNGNGDASATGSDPVGDAEGGTDVALPEPATDAPPADAVADPQPQEVTIRDVVVVEVANEPPAPRVLPSSGADNAIDLDWDAASRSIVSASSTAIFRADSPIQFLASLDDGNGAISTRLTLTNVTEDERLQVGGRMVVTVSGDGGTIRLTSPPLEQVLEPGDEVSAAWDFALPSGDYSIESSYLAG